MSTLTNKIDFVAFISVAMANGNGDPLNGNRPRSDYNGYGELSDVCIKRKIRNRMQDMGKSIFVQSDDRCDDGCKSLAERAGKVISKDIKDRSLYAKVACENWLDVRTFGQVFAFSDKGSKSTDKNGVSVGVRGPVTVHQAVSIDPVDIESMQITKSVNGDTPRNAKGASGELSEKKSSDTMGQKHYVRFGLYKLKGSINVQLAEKTGFTDEDAEVIKECLRTLFVNDASSARPEGSMEVVKLYWFRHNCKAGQYSSAKVHRSVNAALVSPDTVPSSVDDYAIIVEPLDGLEPEIINGI